MHKSQRYLKIQRGTGFSIRVTALFVCLTIVFSLLPVTSCSRESRYPFIHLPSVEDCNDTPTGKKITWSLVYFGSYPSAEVVDSSWNAIDSYALQDGDIIRNDELYSRLESSTWDSDILELDSVRYCRVSLDEAPATADARENHYIRESSRKWHYFMITPICWRVLDVNGDKAFLLADRMPDSIPFNDSDEEVCWSSSTLRACLNGYEGFEGNGFIDRAFTADEKDAILVTSLKNSPNQSYGTSSGEDTKDKIFILSNAEVFESSVAGKYGFDASRDFDDPAKRFTSSTYAKFMGAWWSPVDAYAGNSFWFMRNNGYTSRSVTYICDFGFVYSRGTLVTCSDAAVLPAMWVDLNKADIKDAGERSSTEILHQSGSDEDDKELHDPVKVEGEASHTVWSSVTFGKYPQREIKEDEMELLKTLNVSSAGNTKVTIDGKDYVKLNGRWFESEPVRWRVLKVEDDALLLMADQILDTVPYNDEYVDCPWENSYIRKWLNGKDDSFISSTFTDDEAQALLTSDVSNADNYYFGTTCGKDTLDKVFILSEEEVFSSYKAELYGFAPSDAIGDVGRRLYPTDYAVARGAWVSGSDDTKGIGFWFLRTNGYTRDNVVYVGEKGYLYNRGIPVTCADAGVAPVIRIPADCPLYTVAGDINIDHS